MNTTAKRQTPGIDFAKLKDAIKPILVAANVESAA